MKHYPEVVKFRPLNPSKYVGNINDINLRSSWEVRFAKWCDSNPSVLKWGSEIRSIPYYSNVDRRIRNYFVDFWILIRDKDGLEKKYMVEIKPKSQIVKPQYTHKKNKVKFLTEVCTWQKNQDKWKAADEFARKHGLEFIVLNEYDLGITK